MKSSSVFDKAYSRLYKMILAGEIPAGERLLEIPLSERMRVSRTTIRNVFARLKEDGLVENSDGGGLRVRRISKDELLEMFEFRIMIEPYCVRRVAEKANPEVIGMLEKYLQTFRLLRDRVQKSPPKEIYDHFLNEYFFTDMAFHLSLVREGGNRVIFNTVKKLYVLSNILIIHSGFNLFEKVLSPKNFYAQLYREHEEIYHRVHEKDGEGASRAMAAHLGYVRDMLCKHILDDRPPEGDRTEAIDEIYNFLARQ